MTTTAPDPRRPGASASSQAVGDASPRPLRRRFLVVAILLLAGQWLAGERLPVINSSGDDGLVSSQLWAVYQDSRGYVWIGGTTGLNRFDGTGFTSFSAGDGLHNQVVRTIVEDTAGHLWLGTHDGVARFDGRTFEAFTGASGIGAGVVWASAIDSHGRLWFGTSGGGVSRWDGDAFTTMATEAGLAATSVYSLFIDHRDRLWVGHRRAGVSVCSITGDGALEGCRHLTAADGLGAEAVKAIAAGPDGAVYIGTRGGGVTRVDDAGTTTFTTADGLAGDDIYALAFDHRGRLVVGTLDAGVSLCDPLPRPDRCRHLSEANGLADNAVHGLLEDRDRSLWITLNNGLGLLTTRALVSYERGDGLPAAKVYCVLPADDEVWVGTYGGLARMVPTPSGGHRVAATWDHETGLPANAVWRLHRDRRGGLWLGTAGGLCRFDPEAGCEIVVGADDGLGSDQVLAILESGDDALWVGTTRGLARIGLGPAGEVLSVVRSSLEDCAAVAVAEAPDGGLWVGCGGQGLHLLADHTGPPVAVAADLPSTNLTALHLADDGRLWIGSNGGGLARLDTRDPTAGVRAYPPSEGCPTVATTILPAAAGRFWLTTNRGVILFDPTLAEEHGDGRVMTLDREAGLATSETNDIVQDPDGRSWIALAGGLAVYDPALEVTDSPPPSVIVEQLRSERRRLLRPFTPVVDGGDEEHGWLDEDPVALTAAERNLRFDFTAVTSHQHLVRVESRLVGFDGVWRSSAGSRFREFTNLDPGRYTFQVRAAGRDLVWTTPAEVVFSIAPRPWERPLFHLAAVFLLVLAVAGALRARTARVEARTRELEALVDARTTELKEHATALEEQARALSEANTRIVAAERHKAEFLACMSHELRTPLNAIIGFSEILLGREVAPERRRRFLTNIRHSGHHLLELINNILDLSKIEAGRMEVRFERTPVGDLVDEVCSVMQGYCKERKVVIVPLLADAPREVTTDRAKIRQILFNLLSNAVKFSPPGATVELEIGPTADRDAFAILVRDHGVGIPAEEREAVFDPFFQGGNDGARPPGTGLGLAIVQSFATMLGGSVSLESEPGQGTTFRLVLPVSPSPDPPPSDHP